jgi:hypothetical protein
MYFEPTTIGEISAALLCRSCSKFAISKTDCTVRVILGSADFVQDSAAVQVIFTSSVAFAVRSTALCSIPELEMLSISYVIPPPTVIMNDACAHHL